MLMSDKSNFVAEASKEGGLFGTGGGPVSDKQISTALKLAA
jgi:hypothetical protein